MLGFEVTTVLKRSAFGLDVALPLISDEIRVHITAEAIATEAPQRPATASASIR